MNRVVRGSSLLIVTAIVAACAAQRDEGKADADRQGPAAAAARDRGSRRAAWPRQRRTISAIQEVVVTGAEALRAPGSDSALAISLLGQLAGDGWPTAAARRVYQQPTNTERYQHLDDNPVHLVGRASGLDVLDRRRYRRVRQRAPLPQRRPAAAAGRGARRGDDQLLRLSLCAAGEPRRAVPRRHGSWRRRRGIRRRCC